MNSRMMISKLGFAFVISAALSGCLAGEQEQFFDDGSTTGSIETDLPTEEQPTDGSGTQTSGGLLSATTGLPVPTQSGTPIPTPTASPSPGPIVCNPFGGGGDHRHGLKGKMFYWDDKLLEKRKYTGVGDFFEYGHPANVDFYLSNLNVPTRAWTRGFSTTDGAPITKPNGDPLFEHFGLRLTGGIQLPDGHPSKKMQFALMSDDGSMMWTVHKGDGQGKTRKVVVNNDGVHSPMFTVAKEPVVLSSTERTPIEIEWFQGPREHIALVLLWREWSDTQGWGDTAHLSGGNDYFFDYSGAPSLPLAPWLDILTRWEIVPNHVFYLNGNTKSADENPCH